MSGRKRTFPCGHKGRGQYCHRCAQEQEAQSRKQAWKDTFAQDPIDLRCLPNRTQVEKARTLLAEIAQGRPYTDFRGKRLNHDRTLISVPLGLDYRLLFQDTGSGLLPLACLSHEAYNVKKPGA
jgi:hypothetical protein